MANLREKLRLMWRELNTADAFENDWYGALLNQVGHTALGAILAVFFVTVCRMVFGEMPYRFLTVFVVIIPYLGIEIFVQDWKKGDSAFDAVMVFLGACMIALPFYEIRADGDATILLFVHSHFLMIFVLWLVVLFPHILRRAGKSPKE